MQHEADDHPAVRVERAIAIDQVTEEPLPAPAKPLSLWGKLKLIEALWAIYTNAKASMKKSSWKTTVGGMFIAGAPIVGPLLPDQWHWVSAAMITLGGLFLTQARDNNVTSEDVGAR